MGSACARGHETRKEKGTTRAIGKTATRRSRKKEAGTQAGTLSRVAVAVPAANESDGYSTFVIKSSTL